MARMVQRFLQAPPSTGNGPWIDVSDLDTTQNGVPTIWVGGSFTGTYQLQGSVDAVGPATPITVSGTFTATGTQAVTTYGFLFVRVVCTVAPTGSPVIALSGRSLK